MPNRMFSVGVISIRKRVRSRNEECYGSTKVNLNNSFHIRIAESVFKDRYVFADVMLHELMHVWLSFLQDHSFKEVTGYNHHEIIEPLVKKSVAKLKKLKRR